MPLSQTEFDALVKRLEPIAERNRKQYKLHLRLLGMLGYLYIALVIGTLLLLLLGDLWFVAEGYKYLGVQRSQNHAYLIAALAVILIVTISSLRISFPTPRGILLRRRDVPELFNLVLEVQKAFKSSKIHHILLNGEFNAAVVQEPKLGILGWYQNYLILGLPLMQTLSPEQFKAVLAHEFGHISGQHGQFGASIYRLRKIWMQLLENFEAQKQHNQHWVVYIANEIGLVIFRSFFQWYAPYFSAYSFVLARADEYEADRFAAKITGVEHLATGLITIRIAGSYWYHCYWASISEQADDQPDPPTPFSQFSAHSAQVSLGIPLNQQQIYLEQSLTEQTGTIDTHPCLRDRLLALNYTVAQDCIPLSTHRQSAAQVFLGKALPGLIAQLDEAWQDDVAEQWKDRYNYCEKLRKRLQLLQQKATDQELSGDESLELAYCQAELRDTEGAIQRLQSLVQKYPEHSRVNYLLGRLLVTADQETGVVYLEKAIQQDPSLVISACQYLYDFFMRHQQPEKAQTYYQLASNRYSQLKTR